MSRAGSLALVFFGLLAFFNAIHHPFVHDDIAFILNNPHIAELDHWADAFKAPTVSIDVNRYYRPVLEIIYRLEYHFFGPNPAGYHLFNITIHILNGLLLFGLLQRLSLSKHLAWVIACIFLIHPVQTEAVSCIAGISNLWMALGVLLALQAYLNKWYTATFFCFVVAFLSKEQAIMFVPLVMIIDLSQGAKRFLMWLFWCVIAFVLMWLRQSITGVSLLKDIMLSPGELYLRLAAIPRVIGMDLRLIICPFDLHYYRSTDILQANGIAWVMLLIAVGGVGYIFSRWPQSRASLVLGLGWFVATLLPVLNIAPLINEYSFILTSEHFLYLPIVGILIIVVTAADHSLGFYKHLVLSLVLGACLLLTWHQNTFWRSEIALFERMLRFEPNFGRGHLILARAYYSNGRPEQADAHFQKAFTIISAYAKKANNQTSQKYYLLLEKEILFDWAQNDKYKQALQRGPS